MFSVPKKFRCISSRRNRVMNHFRQPIFVTSNFNFPISYNITDLMRTAGGIQNFYISNVSYTLCKKIFCDFLRLLMLWTNLWNWSIWKTTDLIKMCIEIKSCIQVKHIFSIQNELNRLSSLWDRAIYADLLWKLLIYINYLYVN